MENNKYYLEDVILEFAKDAKSSEGYDLRRRIVFVNNLLKTFYDKINNDNVLYKTKHELLYLKIRYLLERIFHYNDYYTGFNRKFHLTIDAIRLGFTMDKYLKQIKK